MVEPSDRIQALRQIDCTVTRPTRMVRQPQQAQRLKGPSFPPRRSVGGALQFSILLSDDP